MREALETDCLSGGLSLYMEEDINLSTLKMLAGWSVIVRNDHTTEYSKEAMVGRYNWIDGQKCLFYWRS